MVKVEFAAIILEDHILYVFQYSWSMLHICRRNESPLADGSTYQSCLKIFEDFGGALNNAFIRSWEPVSNVHYTRPGTCINRPLH